MSKLLLKNIKTKIGSKEYQKFYDLNNVDILDSGKNSCAHFVTTILFEIDLIKKLHKTVNNTIEELKNSGWYEVKNLKPGAVLVWESTEESNNQKHIGFCLDDKNAISNSSFERVPIIHSLDMTSENSQKPRNIELILWNKKLD